jgi:hypothetical protein
MQRGSTLEEKVYSDLDQARHGWNVGFDLALFPGIMVQVPFPADSSHSLSPDKPWSRTLVTRVAYLD